MKISRCLFVFFLLAVSSSRVLAAWSVEPSYYLRAEHNDNIYLATASDELAVTGGAFSPRLAVIMEEENQMFTSDIDVKFTRYSDQEELDRDEGTINLNWRRGTELSQFRVSVSYFSKSSLDQRLDVSGITDQQVDVLNTSINPSWLYQFAERWSLEFNLSYADVEYDEPGIEGYDYFKVVNFLDYTNKSAGITLIHNFSEQDDISFTYSESRYAGKSTGMQSDGVLCGDLFTCFLYFNLPYDYVAQASERKLDYDYDVWQIGYQHHFDDASNLTLQAGRNNTAVQSLTCSHLFDGTYIEFATIPCEVTETDQSSRLYNIIYKQKSEISSVDISFGRNRVTSSTGGLDETDTAKIFYNRNITERLSWSLDINRENRKPDENTNTLESEKYSRTNATPSVFYKLDKDWSMSLGYRYSDLDWEIDNLPRESRLIYLNMTWREPKLFSTN
ncbi:MAG: hypothetical protein QG652_479 [Pseudomonadota bacterium]|nr:hypothetical protein [Pseudomonadota bacterium]